MKIRLFFLSVIALIFLISAGPKSPSVFFEMFAKLTKSKHIPESNIAYLVDKKTCILLKENRQYAAPVAFSVKGDMKKGAKGVDEYVTIDRGNAYVIKSYSWKNFDAMGSTQLFIEFDTYNCDYSK